MSKSTMEHTVEADHGERISGLEAGMQSLTRDVSMIADTQRQQQAIVNTISSNVERLVATGSASKGKFDLQTVISLLVVLGGFFAYMVSAHLTPMQAQITRQTTDFKEFADHGSPVLERRIVALENKRESDTIIVESIRRDGSPITQNRLTRLEVIDELRRQGLLK